MKKSTKGALASGAAAVLLLGGAGSLAYWTATDDVDGGDITAGTLTLAAVGCDADWEHANGPEAGNALDLFVPGDIITKSCTFTVGATGDNLRAVLAAPATVSYTPSTANTSISLTTAVAFDIDATPIADAGVITSANDGDTLTATFTVTIPRGTDETGTPKINANDTQGLTAALDDLTVTLTQQAVV